MKILKQGNHHWKGNIICQHCQAHLLLDVKDINYNVRYGGFPDKFYFTCPECGKNTPIKKEVLELPLWVLERAKCYGRDYHPERY